MEATRIAPSKPNPTGDLLVLAVAIVFPSFATWLYFTQLGGHPASRPAYAITKFAQFTLPIAWLWWVRKSWPLSWVRPQWRDVAEGLALGLTVTFGGLAIYYGYLRGGPLLGTAPRELTGKLSGFGIRHAGQYLALAMFYSCVHSLLEEYYWRWFVFSGLRRYVPIAAAVAISSLSFMAHHVLLIGHFLNGYGPATWLLSGAIAIGGAIWACQYQRTGALWAPWIGHLVIDAGLMWIGYDLWRAT